MIFLFAIGSLSCTLRPKGRDEVFECVDPLGEASWVDRVISGQFKTIGELNAFAQKYLLQYEANRVISRAPFSNDIKFHFVNFSSQTSPYNQLVRNFVRQNTLVRFYKSNNQYCICIKPVFGRKTLHAYRRQYLVKKGWQPYQWLPLPGNVITDSYLAIQSIAQNTLNQALNSFCY